MVTLGIDLSSQPERTAACLIEWGHDRAVARAPVQPCDDEQLSALITNATVVGIDAPFGWPADFVAAVADWPHEEWSVSLRDRMRFRRTDRMIRERLGMDPLSVSTDRIALPAMRAMSLLRRFGVRDRSGDGRFFEVYPAAALVAWGLNRRGYKVAESVKARQSLLLSIRERLPWLSVSEAYAENSDTLDAFLASLSARICAQGRTLTPSPADLPRAKTEGWIHIPAPGQWPTVGL